MIPKQGATTGTSEIAGQIVVDIADLVPLSKTIDSKTHLLGEQDGQRFDYTNTVHVRVQRTE